MNITRVAVRLVDMNKVKAMVSVTIDDSFVVHGLRVVEGERGFFVAMPSRRLPNGEYRDIAHPINTETRQMVEGLVLGEYRRVEAEQEANEETERASAPEPEQPVREESEPPAPGASEEADEPSGPASAPGETPQGGPEGEAPVEPKFEDDNS